MTSAEALARFGLPAALRHRDELRALLVGEIARERAGRGTEELLRTLCLQLFSLGVADDALAIWSAKQASFDAGCALEIQLICGAGLEPTKQHLERSHDPSAAGALAQIRESERAGEFVGWSAAASLAEYRRYYGLDE